MMTVFPMRARYCSFVIPACGRQVLERHHLTQGLFEAVERHLRAQGYHLSKGTMVDATLIEASGSTKNQARERDREMRSTRKGGWSVSLPNRGIILA